MPPPQRDPSDILGQLQDLRLQVEQLAARTGYREGSIPVVALVEGALTVPPGSITGLELANDAVARAKVATDAIGPDELAADAVNQMTIVNATLVTPAIIGALLDRLIAANVVFGRVSAAGAVDGGDRFTSMKLSTGVYQITFTPALRDVPAFIAMPGPGTTVLTPRLRSGTTPTAGVIEIVVRDSAAVLTDTSFGFIAIA